MKFWYFILILVSSHILAMRDSVYAAPRCSELFSRSKPVIDIIDSFALPANKTRRVHSVSQAVRQIFFQDHLPGSYITEGDNLVAVGQIKQRAHRTLQHVLYGYEHIFVEIAKPLSQLETRYDKHVVRDESNYERALETVKKRKGNPYSKDRAQIEGQKILIKIVLESLDFVMKEYIGRQRWPPEFLQRLVKFAFLYACHSTVINVRVKLPNGQPGPLIASGRLIKTPYFDALKARDQLRDFHSSDANFLDHNLRNELSWFSTAMEIDTRQFAGLNHSMWQSLFENGVIKLSPTDLQPPKPLIEGDLAYIPTLMEMVLNKKLPQNREAAEGSVKYYAEPGNFAIKPDRELPEHLRKMGAAALYFHGARLLREQSDSVGPTTRVGTFAAQGSSSHTLYQYLGLKAISSHSSERDQSSSPTRDIWHILEGRGDALTEALRRRFPSAQGINLEASFSPFDHFENSPAFR